VVSRERSQGPALEGAGRAFTVRTRKTGVLYFDEK
jgi:hypothetical protein